MDAIIESKKVTFEEVLEQFKKENNPNEGTNEFPLKCLNIANKLYGRWIKAKISSDVVNNVVLPSHPRCQLSFIARMKHRIKHDFSFIPNTGLTMEEAYAYLYHFQLGSWKLAALMLNPHPLSSNFPCPLNLFS